MDEDSEWEYRLRIRARPWRATLQCLPTFHSSGIHEEAAFSEQFDSPLDLLARLEAQERPPGGLK
ncbi:hypothetical protein [Deinococcus hopiensis]|uniref:Uncharacterized protein n=1 Tax=Deinococcus hopiensis KR-140 TaxID=695939 RepID=A0A1W1URM1_9DEIO|nr:hypothetical protein [Deinococcus hopiensis]SMB83778.1 hypothetical protein SAMN00790413_04888 [Deinococcus hopiensis KR-140]